MLGLELVKDSLERTLGKDMLTVGELARYY